MENFNQVEYDILYPRVLELLDQGETQDLIEIELKKMSDDPIIIAVAIKEARKFHFTQLRKDGFGKIIIGAILIVVGFVITAFNFLANKSFDFAMYGLTSFGIGFVFYGLYKVIG
ncbi:MAG: hypothetical protein WCR21_10030 [Bacteroidota bacterium]